MREKKGQITPKLFDKTSDKHILLYLSKIIYNTYKCMYIHTTYMHTHAYLRKLNHMLRIRLKN